MEETFDIPVLLVIFCRKDTALQSLAQIATARPSRLYIAGDGPRQGKPGEREAVEETRRAITEAVSWPCEVRTLWRETNLGCSQGVKTAIDWLFSQEERGIIIEDDCVMRTSFFRFAKEMLERYADDERIGLIDGANYIDERIPYSYGFSRYKETNGWATWRRAWKNMDLDMKWRGTEFETSVLANMGYHAKDMKYWRYSLACIDHEDVSAWDWQWYFSLAAQNQLAIYPAVSLQTNIGFGQGATHTTTRKTPERYVSHGEITFPLRHPPYVVPFEPFERKKYQINRTLWEWTKELVPFPLKKWLRKKVRG